MAEKEKSELKFLVDGKDEISVLLEGYDLGYANLMVEKLLQDKDIGFAAVDYLHPTQCIPVLKVKGKSPKKAVAGALNEVKKEIASLKISKR